MVSYPARLKIAPNVCVAKSRGTSLGLDSFGLALALLVFRPGICQTVLPDMIMCREGVHTPPIQAPM